MNYPRSIIERFNVLSKGLITAYVISNVLNLLVDCCSGRGHI